FPEENQLESLVSVVAGLQIRQVAIIKNVRRLPKEPIRVRVKDRPILRFLNHKRRKALAHVSDGRRQYLCLPTPMMLRAPNPFFQNQTRQRFLELFVPLVPPE